MLNIRTALVIPMLAAAACETAAPKSSLQIFGSMRETMREGQHEGRVKLMDLEIEDAIGVGALAGLAGEITIVDGQTLVATARDGGAIVREARNDDEATLLILEKVETWHHFEIGPCQNYEQLEHHIAKLLGGRGTDLGKPTPVRITGNCKRLQAHVIAGACPIANPGGAKPWRYNGPANNVKLVGFYVEGARGLLTHHSRSSHLHAFSDEAMGHLDEIAFTTTIISLPAPTHR